MWKHEHRGERVGAISDGTDIVDVQKAVAPLGYSSPGLAVATLLLFATARQAAGLSHDVVDGATPADVIGTACARYGPTFQEVLAFSRVWVNGAQPAVPRTGCRSAPVTR